MVKLMTGWTINKRPFSKTEFNNSALKKSGLVKTYSEYLNDLARINKPKPKKRVVKKKTKTVEFSLKKLF